MTNPPLILASASPRRIELLALAGVAVAEVLPANIDETQKKGEAPLDYVKRVSLEKAQAVQTLRPDALVLAADTMVVCGRRILDKTEDEAIARKHLQMLSGRRHRVATAVTLLAPKAVHTRVVETRVQFARLTEADITAYLATNEWRGKAGAYAIQGKAAAFIPWVNGSITNVIGLPLTETLGLLKHYLPL
jgi:septum formation protein